MLKFLWLFHSEKTILFSIILIKPTIFNYWVNCRLHFFYNSIIIQILPHITTIMIQSIFCIFKSCLKSKCTRRTHIKPT